MKGCHAQAAGARKPTAGRAFLPARLLLAWPLLPGLVPTCEVT